MSNPGEPDLLDGPWFAVTSRVAPQPVPTVNEIIIPSILPSNLPGDIPVSIPPNIPSSNIPSAKKVATASRQNTRSTNDVLLKQLAKELTQNSTPDETAKQFADMAIEDPETAQFFVNSSVAFVQQNLNWTFIDGTEKYSAKCNYTKTTWNCPAGSFCLSPSNQTSTDMHAKNRCPPGFLCPPHTYQPQYCCPGYFCSTPEKIEICPKNHFCPRGTTKPIKCSWLENCPEGTKKAPKWGVFLFSVFIITATILLLLIRTFFVGRKGRKNSKRVAAVEIKNKEKRSRGKSTVPLLNDDSDSDSETIDLESFNMDTTPIQKFDIRFENLGLKLPSGQEIMKNVTGELNSGRLCAIMGPSGSGKTTFVSLLTGKAKKTSGEVYVNGKPDELSRYQKLIGFVPQEDIMLRELTVNDILMHSALMRLPAEMSRKEKKEIVMASIAFLGLGGVINSVIGDEENRGISGGQRKRVNIGMELVAQPSILFLDEPTSGLDSSTSTEVCNLLQTLAHARSLTVAAIIHSPSPSAYSYFDDLLLLGKGGRVVYFGPTNNAVEYFHRLGFEIPQYMSQPDFFMDIVSDRVKCKLNDQFSSRMLNECWEVKCNGGDPRSVIDKRMWRDSVVSIGGNSINMRQKPSMEWKGIKSFGQKQEVRRTAGWIRVFWLCYVRACRQIFSKPVGFILECLIHLICGIFISFVAESKDYTGLQPTLVCETAPLLLRVSGCIQPYDGLHVAGQFLCIGAMFAGITVGVSTFGNERVVFWRERSTGMHALPYFLAKLVADIPRIVLAAAMFFCAVMLMLPLQGSMWVLFMMIGLVYFNAFASGYFLSTFLPKSITFLFSTAFALIWCLVFNGLNPSISTVNSSVMPWPLFGWIWNVSAPRWAIELYYINEASGRSWKEFQFNPDDVVGGPVGWQDPSNPVVRKPGDLNYGYNSTRYTTTIIALVAISVGWCVLAFLGLKFANRSRQK